MKTCRGQSSSASHPRLFDISSCLKLKPNDLIIHPPNPLVFWKHSTNWIITVKPSRAFKYIVFAEEKSIKLQNLLNIAPAKEWKIACSVLSFTVIGEENKDWVELNYINLHLSCYIHVFFISEDSKLFIWSITIWYWLEISLLSNGFSCHLKRIIQIRFLCVFVCVDFVSMIKSLYLLTIECFQIWINYVQMDGF